VRVSLGLARVMCESQLGLARVRGSSKPVRMYQGQISQRGCVRVSLGPASGVTNCERVSLGLRGCVI
jgi:hypothetical protein